MTPAPIEDARAYDAESSATYGSSAVTLGTATPLTDVGDNSRIENEGNERM